MSGFDDSVMTEVSVDVLLLTSNITVCIIIITIICDCKYDMDRGSTVPLYTIHDQQSSRLVLNMPSLALIDCSI